MVQTRKATAKWAIAALALLMLFGCSSLNSSVKTSAAGTTQEDTQTSTTADSRQSTGTISQSTASDSSKATSDTLVYQNKQYGFDFYLPQSWKGYSIVTSKWDGLAISGESGEKVVETGPTISIRNPGWTSKTPRQDIPIMVFSLSQWNSLQNDEFHIGAAPVGPSELGRNSSYVFALPARYNFAFLPGYEEVETILNNKPLKAF